MSELSNLLRKAKGDASYEAIATKATRRGHQLSPSAVAKYMRDEQRGRTPDSTLQALAAGLDLDVRLLREAAGRPGGELGPYVPDARANSLTKAQREALDRLIVSIVDQGGQTDAGTAEAQKTTQAIRARRDRFLRHNADHPLIQQIENDLAAAEERDHTDELARILDRLDALILAADHGELIDQFRQGANRPGLHAVPDQVDAAAYGTGQGSQSVDRPDLQAQQQAGEENQDEED
ncbi:hypothetical protein HJ590_13330 [Naumannella sp. ID2617S]|nr:hypothetical protein [Naumannella sp. ID2617S]